MYLFIYLSNYQSIYLSIYLSICVQVDVPSALQTGSVFDKWTEEKDSVDLETQITFKYSLSQIKPLSVELYVQVFPADSN